MCDFADYPPGFMLNLSGPRRSGGRRSRFQDLMTGLSDATLIGAVNILEAMARLRRAATAMLLGLAFILSAHRAYADWQALGTYRITGYSACVRCCGKSDGITADGTYAPAAKVRIVAAPKEIPFGTRLWIDGVGEVEVHDRGGAIRGKHLDRFFQTYEEALQWGVQERKVFIWVDSPSDERPNTGDANPAG